MPDGSDAISVRAVDGIGSVAAADWDACAGGDNPFVSHAFLHTLEASGSVRAETGWQPHHLLVEDAGGRLLGAAPMYVKNQSQGEYVFDYGWAHAFERAGGQYYPKVQVAVPFTPVPGPRLLARPGDNADDVRRILIGAMQTIADRLEVSSVHATFVTEDELRLFTDAGWVPRMGQQFHWHNHGFRDFDDFLATLTSRKRKSIRKERREVRDAGITLTPLAGAAITQRHWDAFYRFYIDTYDRKWGYPYLTRAFFDGLSTVMGDKVVLIVAEAEGRLIAGALNLCGADALFGRNWGCERDVPFLHFEACYYQAIDYAIAHGLARVEAGTQGPHKIQRGYLPAPTHSAHYIRNHGFRKAVAQFCAEESAHIRADIAALAAHSPYRDCAGPDGVE